MKLTEKEKAIVLRRKGKSIKEIAGTIGVSKGSVSLWVRDIILTRSQILSLENKQHSFEVIEKRRASRLRNELEKRNKISVSAEAEIDKVSKQELKLIGAALYWAEGAKRSNRRYISFSNSDPIMIKVMMRFFREICLVPERKFRAHIHTHSHLNAQKAEKYWSEVTGISLSQFFKTYSKPSKSSKGKMDPLPYGTLDVSIGDSMLYLRIIGWISKISRLVLD